MHCSRGVFGQGDALDDLSEAEQNVYAKYKAKTLDELNDYMRWNNQHITGTKVRHKYSWMTSNISVDGTGAQMCRWRNQWRPTSLSATGLQGKTQTRYV